MADSAHNPPRAIFAARAMRKPLRSLQRELAGVRRNEDIECVHHMRVASRRLRNAFGLFGDELPAATRDRWRKRLKTVTKALGAARDLDVQIEFLSQFRARLGDQAPVLEPGVAHVLDTLVDRRRSAQREVLSALDRLESSRLLPELSKWVKAELTEADETLYESEELRAEAGQAALQRLGELFVYESYVERPDAIKELHALRIAAKHLRYTLEAYAPLFPDELKAPLAWLRQLQDWLGEIHDCDVWQTELGGMLDELLNAAPALDSEQTAPERLAPGIEHVRAERAQRRSEVYAEFVSAWRQATATGYWAAFRQRFAADQSGGAPEAEPHETAVPNGLPADERLQPVLALAQACHYEFGHTHQVTRLALRLFDGLAKLHGLDDERRYWLTCAALLHDIGWVEGRAGHHKTALRLILESPLLPWDQPLRRIVGSIARYHRKALPSDTHEEFAALSPAQRVDVRKLAAILRVADALDYSHTSVVQDVACRVGAKSISIRCSTSGVADVECTRAAEKGDLAAEVFQKELRIKWHQR